jgi:hypothetical protein
MEKCAILIGWSRGGSSTLLLEQNCDAVIDNRQQAVWNIQLVGLPQIPFLPRPCSIVLLF